jgi:NADH pyrophosphatase NudC (nudix superfamily)
MTAPRYCLHCAAPLTERPIDGLPRLACPSCTFVHFDNPVAVAGVIIRRDDDQVLLVRPAFPPDQPHHVLVSGYLEAYESAEVAAVRETLEETNLHIQVERIVGTYSCRPIGKNMIFIVCLARLQGGTLRLSDELADARWFPLTSLPPWPPTWPVAQAFTALETQRAQRGQRPQRVL